MAALRGIFLTSKNPATTAHFYREVAEFPLEEVDADGYSYWRLDHGDIQMAIHDAAAFAEYAYPPVQESNLTHLYFQIENQAAFVERLGELGIDPVTIDDVVVTVTDPDGRRVMFGTA